LKPYQDNHWYNVTQQTNVKMQKPWSAPCIFTIDANIGAGKTTVLEYLHKTFKVPIDPEPVQKWMPYLEEMYTHDKGAFEFQVRVWLDRCWVQQRPNMSPIIMERSPYFQRNVFVPVNVDNKRLTPHEHQMIEEMYAKSMSMWSPQGYIYLRSDPKKCHNRIAKRARDSEDAIPIDYLESLHKYHEDAYMAGVANGLPIIAIDVEGKTVECIAYETWKALQVLGLSV
jgi:deoxyadenosine/deoxycytidine kinase